MFQSKKMSNEQFRRMRNQNVSANRKVFWKEDDKEKDKKMTLQ